jgi:hypothetical protein
MVPSDRPRARSEIRQSGSSPTRGATAGDFTFGMRRVYSSVTPVCGIQNLC